MERRRLLQAGAGFTLASVAGQFLFPAEASAEAADRAGASGTSDPCSGPTIAMYGVASLTAAIVGMTVLGDKAYVVARGQNPPVLGEIDLPSKTLTRAVRLNRGEGGWATTVSGGHIYAGTYPFPDIYRFDPATGQVALIGTIGPSGGFVWCLTTAPDGTVYAGTSPRGEVWEYKPSTGTLRNLGVAFAGQQYVRAIAADDRFVYAGTLPSGYVVAYDRTTGAKTNITPTPYGGAAAIIARDGRVIAALTKYLVDMAPDGSDAKVIATPAAERLLDAMTMTADGTLYCVGRPTGTVYRRDGDTLVPVAAPTPGDEHRALVPLDATTLLGAAGSGRLWWLNLESKQSEIVELIDAGLSGPDPVQSMAYESRGVVHVGGHFSITTHRTTTRGTRTSQRTSVAGSPNSSRSWAAGCTRRCTRAPSCWSSTRTAEGSDRSASSTTTSSARRTWRMCATRICCWWPRPRGRSAQGRADFARPAAAQDHGLQGRDHRPERDVPRAGRPAGPQDRLSRGRHLGRRQRPADPAERHHRRLRPDAA